MDIKILKTVRLISFILFEGILLLSAVLFGMQNERNRVLQEEEAETVTDIAIVNLDQGVMEDNKIHYYSNELMDLELNNLVSENLEMARNGINDGSYAAYILIPADFSQNAVSINSIPEKSILEYAVNPNLREDVSRLTVANIKNFEINLNSNMSYMYVQAILKEFHEVQDSAGIIMENDSAELARLLEVNPNDLMKSPEPYQVDWLNPEIEDVNFSETFEVNTQISKELRDSYDSFVKEGKSAFEKVKSKENAVTGGMDKFMDIMAEIDVETDEDGNVVYEQGLTNLSEYTENYGLEFEKRKSEIYERINAMEYFTPVPIPKPSETPGGETPSPTTSPKMTPSSTATATPTAIEPSISPEISASPTAEVSTSPMKETPSPTTSPSVKSIPKIIADAMRKSLKKTNEGIRANNKIMNDAKNRMQEIIIIIESTLAEESEGGQTRIIPKRATSLTEIPQNSEEEPEESSAPTEEKEPGENSESQEEQEPEESSETVENPDLESVPYAEESLLLEEQVDRIRMYLNELKEELNQIKEFDEIEIEDIYFEENMNQEFQNLAQMIQELPKLDMEEYNSLFEEGVLIPLREEIKAENERVQKEGSKCMDTMDEYMEELSLFDPYNYYDHEKMYELESSFEENIFDLEQKVYESQDGYLELVNDSIDLSNESMERMQENLEEAYQRTEENVAKEVELAKQYRELMNETNTEILGDFRAKLPYTRIGNLEYVQAYDFIVKPIKMTDTSISRGRVSLLQNYDMLEDILIVMILIWCLMTISLLLIKVYTEKRKNAEGE